MMEEVKDTPGIFTGKIFFLEAMLPVRGDYKNPLLSYKT